MGLKSTFASLLLIGLPLAAAIPEASKPEDVGVSKDRLSRIHDVMQRHMDAREISGAVTLVARKGRVVNYEAHGLMDLESKKPMAKDSIFRIWSMSKVVGGAAILMLMEEGKLRLNDPVSRFIPEFKGMKVAVIQEQPSARRGAGAAGPQAPAVEFYTMPAAREITIRDLLTHISGLGSGPASSSEIRKIERKPGEQLADYIPKLGATPLDFQPGSRWSYSAAAAFDTLAYVIQVASGMPTDQFLKQRIFDPLGMKDTFFSPSEDRWPRVASAYHRAGDALQKVENPNRMVSTTYFGLGGGLMSSAADYGQFAEMLVEGGQLNGKRLLSPRTVELMSSAFVPDTLQGRAPGIGYGLSVQVVTNPIAAGYLVSPGSFGWDGAYGTHFWVDPKEKVIGVMMIQTDNPVRQLDRDFEGAVTQSIVD
jgi:CubicO group peptidase (beta-lactamase class C family)